MSSAKTNGGAASHEDEVKRAADIREWLEEKISELESEAARMKEMLMIVDSVLRKESFIPATELRNMQEKQQEQQVVPTTVKHAKTQSVSSSKSVAQKSEIPAAQFASAQQEPSEPTSRQLRRSKDGMLIANAFVSTESVVVVPTSDVKLSQTTPPFQSFFVNRILKGFETKDKEMEKSGGLKSSDVINYVVEESDGQISKITINNYRDKSRLNEILNTVSWAFSRMLEKR